MTAQRAARPRVVIVGAGFAGLTLARTLRRAPVDVLLVDQGNHHLFQPLLYQVATASLEPADVAYPVRGVLRRVPNATFRLATVTRVDWDARRLVSSDGSPIPFEYLVLAAGATTATFGVAGAEEHAFGLKSLHDALVLRGHLLAQFEDADADPRVIEEGALTVAVIGGGPTGVEMAGSLAELFRHVLARDFPHLDIGRARVVLVEMADVVLGPFHPRLRDHAVEQLRQRGIELRLGRSVTRVRADAVELDDGSVIRTRTVVWAAGVRASPLADAVASQQGPAGRIRVASDLSVPGRAGVWAIGDVAAVAEGAHPQLAPVAIQQARHVAEQIRRALQGLPPVPFRYRDKGIMATIGRRAAVAQLPVGLRFQGTLGWLMWLFLHLVTLIGFRNRLSVLLDWAWSYLTWHRAGRLIIEPPGNRETAS